MAEAPPMFQADGGLQLTAIPGATYYNPESISATPGNATGHMMASDAQVAEATAWCDRMFDAIQTLFLRTPSYQTSKGITRTKGGPKVRLPLDVRLLCMSTLYERASRRSACSPTLQYSTYGFGPKPANTTSTLTHAAPCVSHQPDPYFPSRRTSEERFGSVLARDCDKTCG